MCFHFKCIGVNNNPNKRLFSHTAAASAALFLCLLALRDVGEKGWEVYLETLRLKRQMEYALFAILYRELS